MKSNFWMGLFSSLVFVVVQPVSGAEIDPAKRAEIERVMEVTGMAKVGQQFSAAMVDNMVKTVRAAQPKLTEKAGAIVSNEVNAVLAEHMRELMDQMVAVYDRYYTLDDLRDLNRFYASPVGRKVISTMPAVMRDSMAVGQRWGRSLAPEIEKRIKERCANECGSTK